MRTDSAKDFSAEQARRWGLENVALLVRDDRGACSKSAWSFSGALVLSDRQTCGPWLERSKHGMHARRSRRVFTYAADIQCMCCLIHS